MINHLLHGIGFSLLALVCGVSPVAAGWEVTQTGPDNSARQCRSGSGHVLVTQQSGTANQAEQIVAGGENRAVIVQQGSGNRARQQQNGHGNRSSIVQKGHNLTTDARQQGEGLSQDIRLHEPGWECRTIRSSPAPREP